LAHISKKCFASDFTSLLSETVFCCFSKVEKGLNQQRQTAQTLAAQGFSVLSQLYHQGIPLRRTSFTKGQMLRFYHKFLDILKLL